MSREELIEEIISNSKRLEEIEAARLESEHRRTYLEKQVELPEKAQESISNAETAMGKAIPYLQELLNMKDKSRTDIELTPLKAEIESIFNESNIDEDCDTIARLLSSYRELVSSSLSQGYYADAVITLLEVLESLTYHFVEDEHYNYFDDMYSLDYVCQDMMEAIINAIKSGNFPTSELQRLKDGLEKLKHTEAYEDYGVPYALNIWEKVENSRY